MPHLHMKILLPVQLHYLGKLRKIMVEVKLRMLSVKLLKNIFDAITKNIYYIVSDWHNV